MKEMLEGLIDKPVVIRSVPQKPNWQPIQGIVFEVKNTTVDIMLDWGIMKSIQLNMIVDVMMDSTVARTMILEDPPANADYPRAKRLLFEAEEARYLRQPDKMVISRARESGALFRGVRETDSDHLGTEQMLERAHFLETGRYDYELAPHVTEGELPNHNYQVAKERMERLEADMKRRRPEDEVAVHLKYIARHAGRALVKYPNHRELRAWFEKAEAIRNKLSKTVLVSRELTEPFIPGGV